MTCIGIFLGKSMVKILYSLRPKISVLNLVQICTRASTKLRHLFWDGGSTKYEVVQKWAIMALHYVGQNMCQIHLRCIWHRCPSIAARTPILSHTDLACNTSYHFAASRTVFHRCHLTWPGTVCAFWLTYMIVSLASMWHRTRADMASREPKAALTHEDRHTWITSSMSVNNV